MADGTVVIDTRLNTKGAEAGVSKLKGTLSGMGSAAGKVASGGLKLATNALKAGTVAAAGLTAAALKIGVSFDSSMSKVKAISGATETEFEQLKAKAIEMGDKTQFSMTEAADAMQYMAMAGWKTGDMLDGIEGVMNLAAASGEDLATTSDIVTDGLTAFGMSAKESGRFADVLAAASVNANTNVSMLGESFKYAAPVAGAMGYSVEDTAVALGLMANAGIKASQGGTALRTLLTNMAKPTDNMRGAMEKLGVSLDDGNGNMKSFAEVMKDLRSGFGNLRISQEAYDKTLKELNAALDKGDITQKQYDKSLQDLAKRAFGAEGALKAETAATLAGKEGMSGLLAIVGASEKDFNKLTNAINNSEGAAEEMARTMNDNVEGAFKILQSNLQTFLYEGIYEGMREPITGIIKIGQEYVQAMTKGVQEEGARGLINVLSKEIIPDIIKRATESLPGFLDVGLDMMSSITTGIRQNIPALAPATNEIISALSIGLTAYIAEFFAMGADIIIMICDGISKNSGQIGQEVANAATGIVNSLLSILPSLLKAGMDLIVALANGVSSNIPLIISTLTDVLNQMVAYISNNLDVIVNAAVDLVAALASGLISARSSILEAALTLLNGIVSAVPSIAKNLIQEATKLINQLASEFGNKSNQTKLYSKALELLKNVVVAIGEIVIILLKESPKMVTAVINGIKQLPVHLWTLLQTAIEKVKTWISQMLSAGKDASNGFSDKFMKSIENLPEKLLELLVKVSLKLAVWGVGFAGKAIEIVTSFNIKFIKFLGELPEKVLYALSFVITKVVVFGAKFSMKATEIALKFANAFLKALKELPKKIPGYIQDVLGKFKDMPKSMPEIGENIIKGLWNGIDNAKKWLIDRVKGVGNSVLDGVKDALGIHSPSKRAEKEVGKMVIDGLVLGLQKNEKDAKKAAKKTGNALVSGLIDGVKETSKKASDIMKEMSQEILNTTIEITDSSDWFEEKAASAADAVVHWKSALNSLTIGTKEYADAQKYLAEAEKRANQEMVEATAELTGTTAAWLDNVVSKKEAVEIWKNTVASLTQGTEEWNNAVLYLNSAMREARQEIVDTAISATNASDWFEEDALNAKQIVKYWADILGQLEEGTQEYATAQKYYAEAQRRLADEQNQILKDYAQAQEDIVAEVAANVDSLKTEMEKEMSALRETMQKEIDDLNKIYEDAVNKRADSLYKSMNLFDEFVSTTERTGDSMLSALKSQVTGLENYGDVLDSLAARGLSEDFLDELRDMGPEATADLEVLNNMTDAQLAEYVSLWKQKGKLAHDQAVKDNEQLRIDTEKQIEDIRETYENKMDEVKETYEQKMDEVIRSAKEKLDDLKKNTIQQLKDIGVNVNQKSKENGVSLMDGFAAGIRSKKRELNDYVKSVFSEIVETAKDELDIHSPSRVFRNFGKLSVEGYTLGMEDIDLNKQVQNVFSNGINTLKDITMSLTTSQSSAPVSSSAPVLNFYDTQTSPDAIYQKFYQQQTYGLAREF